MYKRFVIYLYYYRNKERRENCGYAKINIQNEECKLDINIKNISQMDGNQTVYLLIKEADNWRKKEITSVEIKNGALNLKYTSRPNGETDRFLADKMQGVLIYDGENILRAVGGALKEEEFRIFEIAEEEKKEKEFEKEEREKREKEQREQEKETEQEDKKREREEREQKKETEQENKKREKEQREQKKETEQEKEEKEKNERKRNIEKEENKENQNKNKENSEEKNENQNKNENEEENEDKKRNESIEKEKEKNEDKEYKTTENTNQVQKEPNKNNTNNIRENPAEKLETTEVTYAHRVQYQQPSPVIAEESENSVYEYDEECLKKKAENKDADCTEDLEIEGCSMNLNDKENIRTISADTWQEKMFRVFPKVIININGETTSGIKLKPHDIVWFPGIYWRLASNRFLLNGYYNYRYILFFKGKGEQEGRYFLGTPGFFSVNDAITAKKFGFTDFFTEGKRISEGKNFGFWCRET